MSIGQRPRKIPFSQFQSAVRSVEYSLSPSELAECALAERHSCSSLLAVESHQSIAAHSIVVACVVVAQSMASRVLVSAAAVALLSCLIDSLAQSDVRLVVAMRLAWLWIAVAVIEAPSRS